MSERDGIEVTACTRCPALVESRTRIVNGRGDPDADLVLVGEAPGRAEDAAGEPFVGRSGEVLDAAIAALGVDAGRVRITNCVRCRPPANRDPGAGERRNCRSHLDAELARIDPAVVLTLGRVPAEELLGEAVAVTERAGETRTRAVGGAERTLVIGLHPAATLYDRSLGPPFEAALERAVGLAGLG